MSISWVLLDLEANEIEENVNLFFFQARAHFCKIYALLLSNHIPTKFILYYLFWEVRNLWVFCFLQLMGLRLYNMHIHTCAGLRGVKFLEINEQTI